MPRLCHVHAARARRASIGNASYRCCVVSKPVPHFGAAAVKTLQLCQFVCQGGCLKLAWTWGSSLKGPRSARAKPATLVWTRAQVERVAADPASNTTVGLLAEFSDRSPLRAGPGRTIVKSRRPSRVGINSGSPCVCMCFTRFPAFLSHSGTPTIYVPTSFVPRGAQRIGLPIRTDVTLTNN